MQLKLFAMKRTIFPAIDDNYQPKAENVMTIQEYHSTTKKTSRLLLSAQFIYPVVTAIVASFVVSYYLFYQNNDSGKKKLLVHEKQDMKPDRRAKLMVTYTVSVIFSLFAFGMSITAVAHAEHRLGDNVEMWYSNTTRNDVRTMLAGDTLVIAFLFLFTVITVAICCCGNKLHYPPCLKKCICKEQELINLWVILCAYTVKIVEFQ